MRTFAPKPGKNPVVEDEFDFVFLRDDEPEKHHFNVRARLDATRLSRTLAMARKYPEQALPSMLDMIAKMLSDKDGTPYKWSLKPIGEHDPGYDPEAEETEFVAPDGERWPLSAAEDFTRFEAGSSRRRWRYLVDEDDDLTVDEEPLVKLFEWLVGLAAGRPTRPSS